MKTDPEEKPRVDRRNRLNVGYLFLAVFGILALRGALGPSPDVEVVPYSEFTSALEEGRVESVVIGTDRIEGVYVRAATEDAADPGATSEETDATDALPVGFVVNRVEPDLAQTLEQHGVEYSARIESTFLPTLLSWVVPVLLFFGLWMFLLRRFASRGPGAGLMSIGKSKAKVYVEDDTKVSFDDVAGVEEAKDELAEVVSFLKDPKDYGRLGARMPKGVLLVGPPGTGKTLLARAVAGEAGVPFFSISGSEFVEMFVGVGAARVRDLFEQARSKAPCIIFVDELDALGRARNSFGGGGGHDEKEQTLNQLLVELDGFDPSSGIVLLAATNRPEVLDPALLRAGRFDRQVLVDRPDKVGRTAILAVHMKKVLVGDVDADEVASLTPGFTGADLANLVNEAALVATRRDASAVSREDFTAAIERIVAGLEKKNRLLNEREREIVAHHEMGHALVAALLPSTDPVHKVSIIPRGVGALGYTMQRPTEDRFLMTREELEDRIAVLLGGRAAEWLVYGHLSTGASDDLTRATETARAMVTRYAMVPDLGQAVYAEERRSFLGGGAQSSLFREHSEETARRVDEAVREILDTVFERTLRLLHANRGVLDESAQALLESETLDDRTLVPFFERLREPRESDVNGGLRADDLFPSRN